MTRITVAIALCMLSTTTFAQNNSPYVSNGASVYVSRGERSAYVTAPVMSRNFVAGESTASNFIDRNFIDRNFNRRFDPFINNRIGFNAVSTQFTSVYMWGDGWLGRPLIDSGTIGRPEIDSGSIGRPGIDAGLNPSRPIPPRSLRSMNPRAARGPAFSGRTSGGSRGSAAPAKSSGGGVRFGGGR